MKLGLVTYNIAAEWDLETLISTCERLGYEGVELRTTHAHQVEVNLSKAERGEVKKRFDDSPVTLVGLGSTFDYHSADPEELKQNIEGTKEYTILAQEVGAQGVKVRPNTFLEGMPEQQTIKQIGDTLREVGEFAQDYGVAIRLEVHGKDTSFPPHIKAMMDRANHPNVYVCWNSNSTDLDETGSIDSYFDMLKDRINILHINELWNDYPWERLFRLLHETGFEGFCLAEIPSSDDPETVLKYYRKLFLTLVDNARSGGK